MTIKVVCSVIMKNNKVLAALRGKNMDHAGLWELPGGKVNPDECNEDALIREFKEEFKADIIVHKLFCANTHQYQHIKIELIAYWCTLISNDLVMAEHEEVRWMDCHQLMDFKWTEADIPIIEKLNII